MVTVRILVSCLSYSVIASARVPITYCPLLQMPSHCSLFLSYPSLSAISPLLLTAALTLPVSDVALRFRLKSTQWSTIALAQQCSASPRFPVGSQNGPTSSRLSNRGSLTGRTAVPGLGWTEGTGTQTLSLSQTQMQNTQTALSVQMSPEQEEIAKAARLIYRAKCQVSRGESTRREYCANAW